MTCLTSSGKGYPAICKTAMAGYDGKANGGSMSRRRRLGSFHWFRLCTARDAMDCGSLRPVTGTLHSSRAASTER
jgi:hypothetical protein